MYAALNNRFLAALSNSARERIVARCTFHNLPVGTPLCNAGEKPRYCYFITSGLVSVVVPMPGNDAVEVLLVGKEGVTSCMQILGPARNPTSSMVQLGATGYRIRYDDMTALAQMCNETRTRLLEVSQQEMFTLSQVAACNQLHSAEERLSRWLLTSQDRTESLHLDFTQRFLAQMLALERTTVSNIATALQERGAIHYVRGRVTIVDRQILSANACACYAINKALYDGLYTTPWDARAQLAR